MRLILTLAFTYAISCGNTQTPLISHKSHAGNAYTYLIDPSSNFGEIQIKFDPIEVEFKNFTPINDSLIVLEVRDHNQQIIKVDSLPNKKKQTVAVFRQMYEDSIRKEEFKEQYRLEMEQEELLKKQQMQQQTISDPATSKKKKKKSYLLFLFGITGGGMLLIKLLEKSKPSIA